MSTEPQRTCPSCGNELSGAMELCPVCMLRQGLAGGAGSGQLAVELALEIATQVAAGLAAVHKQKLVHRDIKPSNIMVDLEEGGALTAKIIDLGLAKPAPDAPVEAAISTPGAFAGTPEFASPEQFAGVGVDIRSDLYSLGVVLWEMLTGHAAFRGSPAEVMYQHQHAPLPT